MSQDLPERARVVIVGGGVVGCSVAYHLAKQGWSDIVLLERKRLTSGTTWHAAGLIGQLRATANLTKLAKYSAELYATLEQETGEPTGFKQNGSVSLARHEGRLEELLRSASMAKAYGLDVHRLTMEELRSKYPILDTKGLAGAIFIAKDGQADPVNITQALAKGARMHGARIVEGVKVTGILQAKGRAAGVVTDHGTIQAEHVVNCAGMWGREVGRMSGAAVPLQACEHFYVLTEAIPGLPSNLPVLREPDICAYVKEDAGKLLIGCFEPVAKPWAVDGIPEDSEFLELPEDWDHFMPILEQAMERLPALREAGIRKFFNGPESFTPDDRYLLGETPELPGFWVACGFNSIGIQSAGGAGKALAEWMETGRPTMDLWDVDIRRVHPFQTSRAYLKDRVTETLGLLYAMHWPHRVVETARDARATPLHERLAARNAFFGETAGWERPQWFAPSGQSPAPVYSWKRQNFFDWVAAEHMAVREKVGLFDLSSFSKFEVVGVDAVRLLQRVSCADVDVEPGRVVYTQWLNNAGGIEADLTVTRYAADRFLVVTAAATQRRDITWLRRNVAEGERVAITDVTAGQAVLAVMGPRARKLLEAVTPDDVSATAFPFATAKALEIGYAPVIAHRISYVGELGFELYVSAEFARHVFDRLVAAGEPMGLRCCGYHALNTLRLEKAFRHFGHDVTDEDTPVEAGLAFVCRFDKPGGFIGRDAVLRQRDAGPPARRLVQFGLRDEQPLLYHDEPILKDGRIVGKLSSGAYGHWLGRAIGMGYVHHHQGVSGAWLNDGRFEIEIAGERFPAEASLRGFYDPLHARMRS